MVTPVVLGPSLISSQRAAIRWSEDCHSPGLYDQVATEDVLVRAVSNLLYSVGTQQLYLGVLSTHHRQSSGCPSR